MNTPGSNHDSFFEELRSAMQGQNFKSLEEAQAFADALLRAKNEEPLPEFLGLSPYQMHRLLYRPLDDAADIVILNQDLSREDLAHIPIVRETVYFLRRLGELQPLKATVRGFLPRAFAQEMHLAFPNDRAAGPVRPIMSEQDDWKLLGLRHILDMCGWIKKRSKKFSLTQGGKKVVDDGFGPKDFFHLFKTYTLDFNWAFKDWYPELWIIQRGFLFSCYILHLKAKTDIHSEELSRFFIAAFPAVLKETREIPYFTPQQEIGYAFFNRFIRNFCEYFGLVTVREEKKKLWQYDRFVKITPFFEKVFQWKIDLPPDLKSNP